jgi:hypothetical protein
MNDKLADQVRWVEDVFGVTLSAPGQKTGANGGAPGWQEARQAWETSIETVDNQIVQMQAAFRQSRDAELVEIAEFGLNAITGGFKTKLMAAIMDARPGDRSALQSAGPALLRALAEFRTHIETDGRVQACDTNPYGLTMSIRATLGPALAGLTASVEAGMKA